MIAKFTVFWLEFIHLIASESNEICEKETKKTIAGEHVLASLQALGFDDYVEEVDDVFKEHKKQQKVRYIDKLKPWYLSVYVSSLGSGQEEHTIGEHRYLTGRTTTTTRTPLCPIATKVWSSKPIDYIACFSVHHPHFIASPPPLDLPCLFNNYPPLMPLIECLTPLMYHTLPSSLYFSLPASQLFWFAVNLPKSIVNKNEVDYRSKVMTPILYQ